MAAILAGWIAGYTVALFSTVVLTYLAMRLHSTGHLERLVAGEVPGVLLAVPISIANALFWTLIGVVAGAVYDIAGLEASASGLGSPTVGFTITMVSLAAIPLIVLVVLWPKDWWAWALVSGSFAGSFGWLLPHLAGR